jgi:cell division protein FtsZ
MLEFEVIKEQEMPLACIKVIGVGGGGGNTINSMIDANFHGIEFIVTNTDAQALALSKAPTKIQLGVKSTKGLGTGANPELGKRAAEEDLSSLMEHLEDANIVFLTGGLGGGTGSGALPVIARALKEKNILSIAVVTKPFDFEGKKRAQVAQDAIQLLKKEVDTLLIIPNQKLLEVVDKHVSMIDAFAMINGILNQSVKGIADIISKPGHINVDFADVRTIMKDMGLAVMGTGRARGVDRALQAAYQAISSPLLENMSIKGAQSVLLNISGGPDLTLYEISDAAEIITQEADTHANIILGSVIDPNLDDEIIITVIATGFAESRVEHAKEIPVAYKPAVEQTIKAQEEIAKAVVLEEMHVDTKMSLKQESSAIIDEKQEAQEETSGFVDNDDLDIPTFMRQSEQSSL